MTEIWKNVVGYEGRYEVSSSGRVRSVARMLRNTATSSRFVESTVLTPNKHVGGYLTVKLSFDRVKRHRYIHRLVAAAFIGEAPFPKAEVLHGDGDKTNNSVANLSWGSRLDNYIDRARLGEVLTGEAHPNAKLTDIQVLNIRSDPRPAEEVAAEYGMSKASIYMIKRRQTWRHLG